MRDGAGNGNSPVGAGRVREKNVASEGRVREIKLP